GQLGLDRDGQVGLVQPAPGVGGAVPALQRDGADVLALLVVEHLEEGRREVAAHLRRGAPEVEEPVGAVVEDGHGTPSLRLRLSLVDHWSNPPWFDEVADVRLKCPKSAKKSSPNLTPRPPRGMLRGRERRSAMFERERTLYAFTLNYVRKVMADIPDD